MENNVNISLENRFQQLEWLINEFGLLAINFRFDPIILYKKVHSTRISSNLDKFEYIIENVSALGVNEMIFSFATIYDKVKNRMIARGYTPIDPSIERKKEILNKMMEICDKNDIKMSVCCQPDLINIEGIEKAHCIDAYKIEKIIGEDIPKIRDTGQRKDCGCFKSKDIGGYSGIFRCKHNCDYCYASPAKK